MTDSATSPPIRPAARALVVDSDERVVLFRGHVPGRPPWWFAPGGRIEAGETARNAIVRELREEIGLVVTETSLGPPVSIREAPFDWQGVLELHVEDFFLVRITDHDVDMSGFEEAEKATISGHRWWSVAEMIESGEVFSPTDLAPLRADLLHGDDQATLPRRVGI